MKLKLALVTMLVIICSIPMHGTQKPIAAPSQQTVAPSGPMDENSPLYLLAVGFVERQVMNDPKSSAFDKWRAHRLAYNAAYKQSLAGGFAKSGARKVAAAFADGTEMPTLACADYTIGAPSDCVR